VLGAGLVVRAVNHGLGLSTSDTGDFGPPSHQANARQSINGVTRFEAEVLGVGAPSWAADSPAVARVQAFRPGPDDYAVVGIGGNDVAHNLSIARTAANWRWMVARWAAAGLAPSHLLLVTLTPRIGVPAGTVPDRNDSLRAIAAEAGATVIDLCAYVSDDAGESWRSDSLNVGDGVHYSDGVRTWLARRVLATINP
jgi:lysophospholipase L1-like esterase